MAREGEAARRGRGTAGRGETIVAETIEKAWQSLQEWANSHRPSDELRFKDGYWRQIIFVRDVLHRLFVKTYEQARAEPVRIVGSHHSKSVELPVYQIATPDITVTLRYNFYNWNVSVECPDRLPEGWHLGTTSEEGDYLYFEGFPHRLRFPVYKDRLVRGNRAAFSCCVGDDYELYTFLRLTVYALR